MAHDGLHRTPAQRLWAALMGWCTLDDLGCATSTRGMQTRCQPCAVYTVTYRKFYTGFSVQLPAGTLCGFCF